MSVQKKQPNQCDGCRAGKPLNDNDCHVMGDPKRYADLQACTAERYGHEPGCPPDGPHCCRCGYCEFKLNGEQCLCYAR